MRLDDDDAALGVTLLGLDRGPQAGVPGADNDEVGLDVARQRGAFDVGDVVEPEGLELGVFKGGDDDVAGRLVDVRRQWCPRISLLQCARRPPAGRLDVLLESKPTRRVTRNGEGPGWGGKNLEHQSPVHHEVPTGVLKGALDVPDD